MKDSFFTRALRPGDAIRPFMVAGTLEKDYPGERNRSAVRAYLEDSFRQACADLNGRTFKEYDTFTLCGMEGRWTVCSALSPRYAAGHYYIMEKLGMMPIYLELETEQAQTISIKINADRVLAMLNGEVVYNNEDIHTRKHPRRYVFEHNVNTDVEIAVMTLRPGKNVLTLVTGRIDRGTGMQFSMELLESEAPLYASVPLNMPEDVRSEIFMSQQQTHMVDDNCLLGETPVLHIGGMPLKSCRISAVMKAVAPARPSGTRLKEYPDFHAEPLKVDTASLSQEDVALPADCAPGPYEVTVSWTLPDGTPLYEDTYGFSIVEPVAPMPGFDRFEERRQFAIDRLAEAGNPLALFRLGRGSEIDLAAIDAMCKKIEKRADCADFDLLPLLWLIWEDRHAAQPQLDPYIHQRVREAALSFRYWVDEPESSSMFYCSENHRIGFHVCEYLAGLLYPTDFFTCAQQNGMYHSLKGRMHLVEWLNQRCRAGFDEPHSDSYLPVTMSAILVLREVLPMEEYPLRNMVNVLLEFLSFIYAVSNFDGVMATPRGRSYNKPLRSCMASSINSSFWMLFGNCASHGNFNQELAFSPYVPPRGICELAYDYTPATFTFKEGIMHFDKHNADFTIRRTPDYMMGGVRDHNVGMCDMHFISSMIALKGDISIFFSAPQNTAEGSGLRPDYWAGQAFLPRVLMGKRTLAVIWHNVNNPDIWMTHCHFNARKFDEVVQRDGWTFGRSGDGYVGIYSSKPHSFRKEGLYAGRELICDGNEVVWLAECGSASEDGSFPEFIERMVSAQVWQDGETFHFDSPGSGLMEFGLTEGFTIDRRDVPIPEYTVDCPWLRSRFGSGRFEYNCPGFKVTQWSYPLSE